VRILSSGRHLFLFLPHRLETSDHWEGLIKDDCRAGRLGAERASAQKKDIYISGSKRCWSVCETQIELRGLRSPVPEPSLFPMQSSTSRPDQSYISLGERRGKSDLARFSLDLSWARAVSDSARSRAYPSPPMSGSPPLPPRRNLDSSDRGHGSYVSSGQDVYRGMQAPSQMEPSEPSRVPPIQGYPPNPAPPAMYAYRAENMPPGQLHYQQPLPQMSAQQSQQSQQPPSHLPYAPLPPQAPAPFSAPDRPPIREGPDFSSPKQQRKTKGHVASACVPCKKAHLR
jgi:hypothetical protein